MRLVIKASMLLFALVTISVYAVPQFFVNTVFITLSKNEIESLKAFVGKSLNEASDQQKTVWRSPESSTVGVFKGIATFTYNGKQCRRGLVGLKNDEGKKDIYRFDFCMHNGKWMHSPTPLMTLTKDDKDSILSKANVLLDSGSLKQPMAWRSVKGNVAGALVLVSDSGDCKEIALSLSNQTNEEINGVYQFCKSAEGWKYTPE